MKRRWAAPLSGALVWTLVGAALAGCEAPPPDRLAVIYVEVPVNRPATLDVAATEASVWAESDRAMQVRCWASGPDGAPRAELRSHARELSAPQPVVQEGEEYLVVGKLPTGPGKVTVECRGPAGTRLYAALTRPPEE